MTVAIPNEAPPSELTICQSHLDSLIETHAHIDGAIVSSVDGFEIAAKVKPSVAAGKLAAMTSSLFALAEAVCEESVVGGCRDIVVDAHTGRILLMSIPYGREKFVLTVLCDHRATLGQVLWAARECREEIARKLSELSTSTV